VAKAEPIPAFVLPRVSPVAAAWLPLSDTCSLRASVWWPIQRHRDHLTIQRRRRSPLSRPRSIIEVVGRSSAGAAGWTPIRHGRIVGVRCCPSASSEPTLAPRASWR
jgi:hypothetical protein